VFFLFCFFILIPSSHTIGMLLRTAKVGTYFMIFKWLDEKVLKAAN